MYRFKKKKLYKLNNYKKKCKEYFNKNETGSN